MREQLISELRDNAPARFVEQHIFDRVPHVFAESKEAFMAWRRELSAGLEVDASDIVVVGSAAIGISLNPYKNFKIFDNESDIDVAVVSLYHFQDAWRFFRRNSDVRARLNGRARSSWDEHRTRLIYFGTIATDHLLPLMPFGRRWLKCLDKVRNLSCVDNEINVRLYTDFDALRRYQIQSVDKRRAELLSPNGAI